MKEEISRHPLNAPGRYYVDCDTCIDHECCVDAAPKNFRLDENYSAFVFKQPETAEEEAQCRRGHGDIRNGDTIVLKANNGHYVVAENVGDGVINANRKEIGPWEKFTIVVNGQDRQ